MENETNEKTKPASSAAKNKNKKTARSWHTEKFIARKMLWLAAIALVLVWLDNTTHFISALRINREMKNKWQAVFLTNGQVYFGHLSRSGFNYWKLDDVYYMRVAQVPVAQPMPSESETGNNKKEPLAAAPAAPQMETQTSLVKMSNDLHAPEKSIIMPASQILFWQNLRNDSQVVKTIAAQK